MSTKSPTKKKFTTEDPDVIPVLRALINQSYTPEGIANAFNALGYTVSVVDILTALYSYGRNWISLALHAKDLDLDTLDKFKKGLATMQEKIDVRMKEIAAQAVKKTEADASEKIKACQAVASQSSPGI